MSSMYVTANFFDEHNAEDLKNKLVQVISEVKKLSLKEDYVYEYDKENFKKLLAFIEMLESEAGVARKISSYDEEKETIPEPLMTRYRSIASQVSEFFGWIDSYWHQKILLFYAHAWTMTNKFQLADPKIRYATIRQISELSKYLVTLEGEVQAETIDFDDWLMLSKN